MQKQTRKAKMSLRAPAARLLECTHLTHLLALLFLVMTSGSPWLQHKLYFFQCRCSRNVRTSNMHSAALGSLTVGQDGTVGCFCACACKAESSTCAPKLSYGVVWQDSSLQDPSATWEPDGWHGEWGILFTGHTTWIILAILIMYP